MSVTPAAGVKIHPEERSEVAPAYVPLPTAFSADSPNLDFLRTFAVLCVFVRHIISQHGDPTNAWFQPQALGIFGVLAFFVHTSLVLMMSIDRHQMRTGLPISRLYLPFLVRRAFRIYPLSMVVILLCWFVLPPTVSRMAELAAAGQTTIPVLASNLALVNNLNGTPYVMGTLWTLPLELQMYLTLPILFLVARRTSASGMFGIWIVSVALAASRYVFKGLPEVVSYAPCFVAGVLCFRLPNPSRKLAFRWLPILLLALLTAYMFFYGRYGAQTPLGWLVCLALALILPSISQTARPWLKQLSFLVARYSYGIYLTHMFTIKWVYQYGSELPEPLKWLAAAGITTTLSIAAFHFIEAPLMNFGSQIAGAWTGRRRATAPA